MNKELFKHIDVEAWKKIQDKFSKSIGLPVITIDEKGNELITSEFPFFCQLIKSRIGEKCLKCREQYFERLKKQENKILVYYCHAGLLNIMVPIHVNGKQMGAVVCEGALNTDKNIAKCRRLSKETRIHTLELLDELKSMRLRRNKDIEKYATLLFLLSQTIPEVVHEKHEVEKKANELQILNSMSGILNSSLEMDKIMDEVIKFLCEMQMVDGCSIILLNKNERYGNEIEQKILYPLERRIIQQIKKTKETITVKDFQSEPEFEDLPKVHYSAMISIPLISKGELQGALNIYPKPGEEITENDYKFFSIIADQITMAIINAQQYELIRLMAITDKLTGLYNRRHFMKILDNEVERVKRTEKSISIALIDLDNFTNYNNTHGHPAGDRLLQKISEIFRKNVRTIDTVGRYGGEEFIVILPEADINQAGEISERLRRFVEIEDFEGQHATISMGVATFRGNVPDKEQMIQKADELLYRAKDSGKNKVVSEEIQ